MASMSTGSTSSGSMSTTATLRRYLRASIRPESLYQSTASWMTKIANREGYRSDMVSFVDSAP